MSESTTAPAEAAAPAPGAFGLLRLPESVLLGAGTLRALPTAVSELGTNAFVVADPFVATTPWFAEALAALEAAGVRATVSTDVVPELPVDSIERVAETARGASPEVVVGIGGGSALDLAKLVALLLAHPGPLSRYYGENAVPGAVLPIVAVPTTAGTGSEVTPVAVVSDPERELKVGVSSPRLIPRRAIVDPVLAVGAPAPVTAFAGIDAFVHAVESFTARRAAPDWSTTQPVFVGRNLLSSLVGLEAVRVIGANLRDAVRNPGELAPREAMAYGSLLAGMAFATGGTHLSHAVQYPVGAATKTPHGLGTGLLLPYVLEALRPETVPELNMIGDALDVPPGPAEERAIAVVAAVRDLVHDIGVPASLAELGVTREQLPRFAELSLGVTRLVQNAAVPATPELLDAVLEAAWSGRVTSDAATTPVRN
ncbi:iron-containing alcohol dehydrogenase [Gryllotalpicola reticulitermitis]|uniref:Iron-containing alcohol dehydrogenase n=1 Tax=Gryllotalpicola reticulitermitis TaxID=1184153 RepID=A0ABV8Q428_9MICO